MDPLSIGSTTRSGEAEEADDMPKSTIRKKTVIQELPTKACPAPGVRDSERSPQVIGSRKEEKAPNDAINERVKASSEDSDLPDPMGHIRKEIESRNKLTAISEGRHRAVFEVNFNQRKYISEELNSFQSLASILTVSGSAKKAYSTSCADYVRWLWPENGLEVLKAIQCSIDTGTGRYHNNSRGLGPDDVVFSAYRDTFMIVRVQGSQSLLISIAQQLAWLAAILNPHIHRSEKLTYSNINFSHYGAHEFHIDVETNPTHSQLFQREEKMCWHPLFAPMAIAYGFPVPPRNAEMGVEISFEIMLGLAGINYAVTYDDGLVLSGFSTLLFPSAYYPPQSRTAPQSHSVQWHLVTSTDDHTRISAGVELARCDHLWVKIKDEELLQSARTFLGHCRAACVHLGTENSGFSGVSESGLADEKPNPTFSVRSGTIGTSGLGIFGAAMNIDVVLPRGLARSPRIDYYNEIIRTAKNMPLILYDTDKKQAWLVPALSVILHMAHAWVATHAPDVQLPYAQPDWDGGQAAWNIIAESSRLELQRSLEDDTPYLLKDLVKRLWEHLISCFDSTMLDTRRNRGMIETGRPKLRGWEYMDIIDPPIQSRMKDQVLDRDGCGWDLLTEHVLVLVCKGLGEIIQPAQPGSLCSEVYPVQRGRNYLTASVACLRHLSQKCGNGTTCTKLADGVFWPLPSPNLFDDCVHGIEEPCHQTLQKLVNKEGGHEPKTPPPAEGAVLFGRKVNKLKKMVWRSMAEKSSTPIASGNVFGSSNPCIAVNATEHALGCCTQPIAHTEPTASSGQTVENGDISELSSLALADERRTESSKDQRPPMSLVEPIPKPKDKTIRKSLSQAWRKLLHR